MKKVIIGFVFAGFIMAMSSLSNAQSELMVFPKDGQSKEEQAKDTTSCKSWAKDAFAIALRSTKTSLVFLISFNEASIFRN